MVHEIQRTARFARWFDGLRDPVARARIGVRIARLVDGHAGQHRALSRGVVELKLDFGPGYRVYYRRRANDRFAAGRGRQEHAVE